jgi:hypothetical protein
MLNSLYITSVRVAVVISPGHSPILHSSFILLTHMDLSLAGPSDALVGSMVQCLPHIPSPAATHPLIHCVCVSVAAGLAVLS